MTHKWRDSGRTAPEYHEHVEIVAEDGSIRKAVRVEAYKWPECFTGGGRIALADYWRPFEREDDVRGSAGEVYRHKKRGTEYTIIAPSASLESNMERMVVYQDRASQQVWVCPYDEFFDGRFELVAP